MAEQQQPTIIIIKKKGGHAGHHGGAWKVAYADFVTAMMAFFMVMWLMNSSEKVQKAVGGYFTDPTGYGKQQGSGQGGSGDGLTLGKQDLGKIKDELEKMVKQQPQFQKMKDQVQMTVTGEGLRVELLETEKGMFFESGNQNPSGQGEEMLRMLAKEMGKLPNKLMIEGHTDAKPFNGRAGYSNWELSVERANAARKVMESGGLREGQVFQVRGFADRRLRKQDAPEHASNRRISVIVQYEDPKPEAAKPEVVAAAGAHAKPPAKAGAH